MDRDYMQGDQVCSHTKGFNQLAHTSDAPDGEEFSRELLGSVNFHLTDIATSCQTC